MKRRPPEPQALRHEAIQRLGQLPTGRRKFDKPEQQELEIHRIELEMQNESLRASQEELSASLDRYTQLFDFAPIGYATLARDGKVLEVNHVGANLLDASRSQIVGHDVAQFVAPTHRTAFDALVETVHDSCVKKSLKVQVLRRFGEFPWIQITADSLAGHPPTLLLAFEDITVQLQAEQRLREADAALRTSDRRKDEFLAVLSHELRTPLSSLLMHGQLLRDGGLTEHAVIRSGQVIERAARAQAKLIDDLLDVSRIVSGKLILERQEVDVSAVVEAAIDTVSAEAQAKQVRLEVMLDPGVSTVLGDPGRLQQALQNLLTNAVKFTPAKGRVFLSVDEIQGEVRIEVRDTGTGIEPEFLPQVFRRFAQANLSSTRAGGGLGLGLSIAHSIVDGHRGSIQVESRGKNQGATFTVRLPSAHVRSEPPPPVAKRQEDRRLQGTELLVLEDDELTRLTLTQVLESAGATVYSAESGERAMKVLSKFRPDLLVCDIAMPNEDGIAFLGRLRAKGKAKGGDVGALALTAFADEAARARTRAAGFLEHLAKPVDVNQLISTVASLIARHGASPPVAP